jgi:hypothetical protein
MSDYWCATCCEWRQIDRSIFATFFTPRCEECGAELEEHVPPESYEVDYKEVDVSWAFQDDDAGNDTEDETEDDEEEDTEDDADSDGEDAETDGESE